MLLSLFVFAIIIFQSTRHKDNYRNSILGLLLTVSTGVLLTRYKEFSTLHSATLIASFLAVTWIFVSAVSHSLIRSISGWDVKASRQEFEEKGSKDLQLPNEVPEESKVIDHDWYLATSYRNNSGLISPMDGSHVFEDNRLEYHVLGPGRDNFSLEDGNPCASSSSTYTLLLSHPSTQNITSHSSTGVSPPGRPSAPCRSSAFNTACGLR